MIYGFLVNATTNRVYTQIGDTSLANASVPPHFLGFPAALLDDEAVGILDEPLGEGGCLGDASTAGVAAPQVVVLPAARLALQLCALRTAVADTQRLAWR